MGQAARPDRRCSMTNQRSAGRSTKLMPWAMPLLAWMSSLLLIRKGLMSLRSWSPRTAVRSHLNG